MNAESSHGITEPSSVFASGADLPSVPETVRHLAKRSIIDGMTTRVAIELADGRRLEGRAHCRAVLERLWRLGALPDVNDLFAPLRDALPEAAAHAAPARASA